jgi:hypothetical protein
MIRSGFLVSPDLRALCAAGRPIHPAARDNVEYKLATSKFCPQANSSSYNFNSILKDVNLYDIPYTPCR